MSITVDQSQKGHCLSCVCPDGWVAAAHLHVAGRLEVDVGVQLLQGQLRVCLGLFCSLVHLLSHAVVNCLSQKSQQLGTDTPPWTAVCMKVPFWTKLKASRKGYCYLVTLQMLLNSYLRRKMAKATGANKTIWSKRYQANNLSRSCLNKEFIHLLFLSSWYMCTHVHVMLYTCTSLFNRLGAKKQKERVGVRVGEYVRLDQSVKLRADFFQDGTERWEQINTCAWMKHMQAPSIPLWTNVSVSQGRS